MWPKTEDFRLHVAELLETATPAEADAINDAALWLTRWFRVISDVMSDPIIPPFKAFRQRGEIDSGLHALHQQCLSLVIQLMLDRLIKNDEDGILIQPSDVHHLADLATKAIEVSQGSLLKWSVGAFIANLTPLLEVRETTQIKVFARWIRVIETEARHQGVTTTQLMATEESGHAIMRRFFRNQKTFERRYRLTIKDYLELGRLTRELGDPLQGRLPPEAVRGLLAETLARLGTAAMQCWREPVTAEKPASP